MQLIPAYGTIDGVMDYRQQRLNSLRDWMQSKSLDLFIVPTTDPHLSEYPPTRYRCRSYLTGFTGSAGTFVITRDHAALWTDSRYYLEAEFALTGSGIELFRLGESGVLDYPEWIAANLPTGSRAGIDARCVAIATFRTLESGLKRNGITLVGTDDPMRSFWNDRPNLPSTPLVVHDSSYSGEPATARLMHIRKELDHVGARSHVVCTLDDIAWILNLRASDVDYNPVAVAFLIVDRDEAQLYTDPSRVTAEAQAHCRAAGVAIVPYPDFWSKLSSLEQPVLTDPERVTMGVLQSIDANGTGNAAIIERAQPSTARKARRNQVELNHTRKVMVRDGVAMVQFLSWLERTMAEGTCPTELEAAAKLRAFRAALPGYVGDSFEYISSYAGHGAIIHYRAKDESQSRLRRTGTYLIDSGAQYLDGTTDITRTVALGEVEPMAKDDFTLVLRAHIALATTRFPLGTTGRQLDSIPRRVLWQDRRNYGHGTGHGVGFFLSVHEGPQRIAQQQSDWPLEEGMVISNEPGLYRRDRWGMRTENLLAVGNDENSEFGSFLRFETLTLCPIDRRMIVVEQLDAGERKWIDEYHRRVRTALESGLEATDRAWLESATKPL